MLAHLAFEGPPRLVIRVHADPAADGEAEVAAAHGPAHVAHPVDVVGPRIRLALVEALEGVLVVDQIDGDALLARDDGGFVLHMEQLADHALQLQRAVGVERARPEAPERAALPVDGCTDEAGGGEGRTGETVARTPQVAERVGGDHQTDARLIRQRGRPIPDAAPYETPGKIVHGERAGVEHDGLGHLPILSEVLLPRVLLEHLEGNELHQASRPPAPGPASGSRPARTARGTAARRSACRSPEAP